MTKKSGPILVAMSGGVDSSVVAAMLRDRGHDVIGVTMQIWQESQRDPRHSGCCSLGAVEDARRVARILDIPHYVISYKDTFREKVIQPFIEEYARGRTPNPCVECNRSVKFESLMTTMHELGCSKIATGHYARVRYDQAKGRYRLMRGLGGDKDQSYVLYMLSQEQLAHVYFPLGELGGKAQTRKLAEDYGLPVAHKPDSQEICFVSEAGGYAEFLRKENPELFKKGEIVDSEGKVIGEHEGIAGYTVGQRRGIGITTRDNSPLFVLKLHPSENKVVVGNSDDLLQTEVHLDQLQWSSIAPTNEPLAVKAKIRYNMEAVSARLIGGARPKLVFRKPVRAVTPGQIAVAYRGESIIAGGVITAREKGT